MLQILLLIVLGGLLAWFWMDSLRAREAANAACSAACRRLGVQFLDHTVALQRLRLARDPGGRLQVRRHYTFEYSDDGQTRHRGHVELLGARLRHMHLPTLEAQDAVLGTAQDGPLTPIHPPVHPEEPP